MFYSLLDFVIEKVKQVLVDYVTQVSFLCIQRRKVGDNFCGFSPSNADFHVYGKESKEGRKEELTVEQKKIERKGEGKVES